MSELIAIAVGGAFGAIFRFWITNIASLFFDQEFPSGILIVNILGSFLIGILFVLLIERAMIPAIWRSVFIVGFLGAFTTFSTFSLQALGLIETGRLLAATMYVGSSVVVGILAVAFGMYLARLLP